MKLLKKIKAYFECKKKGYSKEQRIFYYAIHGIITINDYIKYIDNKIMEE